MRRRGLARVRKAPLRYWRLYFRNVSAGSFPPGYFEVQMREVLGGADLTTAALAIARSAASSFNGGREPAKAFDDDEGTPFQFSSADNASWLSWDFAAEAQINQVTLYWWSATTRRHNDIAVESSIDGVFWTEEFRAPTVSWVSDRTTITRP